MKKFLQFVQYHNSVPVAISCVLLGAGGVFAATNPQAIYSSQQQVLSIDNTYLVHKDLSNYSPQVVITGVAEDPDNYYVGYTLLTIDLQDSIWRDVQKNETMDVSKADLGPYRDLGVYVTKQLRNVVQRELARLQQTQTDQRSNVTQKEVATTYGGLIGKFLNTTTEVLPGYTPVVAPPPPSPEQLANAASSQQQSPDTTTNTTTTTQPQNNPQPSGAVATIQILGNNPANLKVGDSYADLGAVITGPTDQDRNLGIHTYLDGVETYDIVLNTSQPGQHLIDYIVTNAAGPNKATRVVVVSNPFSTPAPTTVPADSGTSTPPPSPAEDTSSGTSAQTPLPAPTPDASSTPGDATSAPPENPPMPAGTSGSTPDTTPATTTSTDASSTSSS